tara:strand:- start:43067 stop:43387 length:321 start_codon:yes stop_codon:yes gene_type:complete
MTPEQKQLEQSREIHQRRLELQKETLKRIENIKKATKLWDWLSLVVAVFTGWMLREVIVHDPRLWAYTGTGLGCLFIIAAQVLNQRRTREACEMFHEVFMKEEQET